MLKRGDRLSPKRRERKLDISVNIEGLLLLSLFTVFTQRQPSHGGLPRRGPSM
jgi:hypothetical protein